MRSNKIIIYVFGKLIVGGEKEERKREILQVDVLADSELWSSQESPLKIYFLPH